MQVQDRKQHMFSGRSDNWMPSAPLWPSACEHPEGDAVVHPKWALRDCLEAGWEWLSVGPVAGLAYSRILSRLR
jgi:hypothetical protein